MTIDNWLSILTLIILIASSIGAIIQWVNSNNIKRSEFLKDIIDQLRNNQNMVVAFHIIEYQQDWYDKKFHNGANEQKIDGFLALLNYICYLDSIHLLRKKEFSVLKYEIFRTLVNGQSQGYLWNLYHFSNKFNQPCPYIYLIEYGLNQKILDTEFNDPNSSKYPKYLNF